jgi:hypothetical protein
MGFKFGQAHRVLSFDIIMGIYLNLKIKKIDKMTQHFDYNC